MAVKIQVIGGARVAQRIERRRSRVHRYVLMAVKKWTITMVREVKQVKLRGGNPLHSRTGNLSRSIHSTINDSELTVMSSVGTNLLYGKIHEFGKIVTVPAHLRMVTQAWGRRLRNPHQVMVRTHKANYPERSFLRSALRELAPEAREQILAGVNQALRMPV